MTCNIIASGSSGNAVQVGGRLLIDCGVPYKHLKDILSRVNVVLLTHVHGDHFNKTTIRRVAQEHPLLRFACCQWLVLPLVECGVDPRRIDRMDPGKQYTYNLFDGKCVVEPVALVHDVPNCGYKITLPNGERVLYATDTGTLDGITAKNFDVYLIEANYDDAELQERMNAKLAAGEFAYESRTAATHLSRAQAIQFLTENAKSTSKFAFIHQHKNKEGETDHA